MVSPISPEIEGAQEVVSILSPILADRAEKLSGTIGSSFIDELAGVDNRADLPRLGASLSLTSC